MSIETFPAFVDNLTSNDLREAAQQAKDDGLHPSATRTFDTTDETRFVLVSETISVQGQPDRTVRPLVLTLICALALLAMAGCGGDSPCGKICKDEGSVGSPTYRDCVNACEVSRAPKEHSAPADGDAGEDP